MSGSSACSQVCAADTAAAWAISPTIVKERDGPRRSSSRHCIGDSSWASSTTIWPYAQARSAAARSAVVPASANSANPAASFSALTSPSTPMLAIACSAFSTSRLRCSLASRRTAASLRVTSPSSSAASSSSGMSEIVNGAERSRRRRARSWSVQSGVSSASQGGLAYRSCRSFCGVSGSHAVLSATRTSLAVRRSSRSIAWSDSSIELP